MTVCTAGFETGVNTNNISTSDTGDATAWSAIDKGGDGAATYSNTQTKFGSLAGKLVVGTSGRASLRWDSTAIGSLSDLYGRFYVWLSALPTQNTWLVFTFRLSPFASAGAVILDTSGHIVCQRQGASSATGTVAVATSQWTRIEWHVVAGGSGLTEAKLFNSADSSTASETITTATGANGVVVDYVSLGLAADGADKNLGVTSYWDQITAGNGSYPGPYSPPGGGGLTTHGVGRSVIPLGPRARTRRWERRASGLVSPVGFGPQRELLLAA